MVSTCHSHFTCLVASTGPDLAQDGIDGLDKCFVFASSVKENLQKLTVSPLLRHLDHRYTNTVPRRVAYRSVDWPQQRGGVSTSQSWPNGHAHLSLSGKLAPKVTFINQFQIEWHVIDHLLCQITRILSLLSISTLYKQRTLEYFTSFHKNIMPSTTSGLLNTMLSKTEEFHC